MAPHNNWSEPTQQADFAFAVSLMQHLVVPTFVLDAQGRVVIWNKACERLTGIAAGSVLGTQDHWRAFYEHPRPCLADLVAQGRLNELDALYEVHNDPESQAFGVKAENWCRMPQLGHELYLAIDVGPIYDQSGQLMAVVETLRDMTTEKRATTELERLATRDGLTGLANRHHFDQMLLREWARARRDQEHLGLIMVDVDHFKRYNDQLGHLAGDGCLRAVARLLEGALVRPGDMAARYGGEEFVVFLPDTDMAGVETVAQRLQRALTLAHLPHPDSDTGRVTVSMGLASVRPSDTATPAHLVQLADQALYDAKRGGRNGYRCA